MQLKAERRELFHCICLEKNQNKAYEFESVFFQIIILSVQSKWITGKAGRVSCNAEEPLLPCDLCSRTAWPWILGLPDKQPIPAGSRE